MSPHGNPEFPGEPAPGKNSPVAPVTESEKTASPAPVASTDAASGGSDTNGGEEISVLTSSTAEVPVSASPTSGYPVSAGAAGSTSDRSVWPLWEVFVRSSRGLSHVHAGSLHAPDAAMALRNARDLYTRRNEGVSIWVVPADAIAASDPDAKGSFFESPQGKDYRHATYYTKSEGVKHL
jgi:ring-1,2-phenylacetyl-CoA epoxidase subunit PaaB